MPLALGAERQAVCFFTVEGGRIILKQLVVACGRGWLQALEREAATGGKVRHVSNCGNFPPVAFVVEA